LAGLGWLDHPLKKKKKKKNQDRFLPLVVAGLATPKGKTDLAILFFLVHGQGGG
jgi:hypothetical protein